MLPLPNPDRVARLITGEGVPDATMVDLEAAKSLLLTDRAITDAMSLESLRRFAASARTCS